MAIEITDKAVEEVRRMMQKEGVSAAGMRVGVKGGGCSGLSYNLSFENQARTGDKVFERENVKLFCDLKSYIYLNGTVLDLDALSRVWMRDEAWQVDWHHVARPSLVTADNPVK